MKIDGFTMRFFSVEFFNEEGIEVVSELLESIDDRMTYDIFEHEVAIGNHYVAQNFMGRIYVFSEPDKDNIDNEISFNQFKRMVEKQRAVGSANFA